MAKYWFLYRPDTGLQIDDPQAYRQISRSVVGVPPCLTGPDICAVYALGTTGTVGSLPAAFFFNLQTYITDSVSTNIPLPAGGPKYFVYKRTI